MCWPSSLEVPPAGAPFPPRGRGLNSPASAVIGPLLAVHALRPSPGGTIRDLGLRRTQVVHGSLSRCPPRQPLRWRREASRSRETHPHACHGPTPAGPRLHGLQRRRDVLGRRPCDRAFRRSMTRPTPPCERFRPRSPRARNSVPAGGRPWPDGVWIPTGFRREDRSRQSPDRAFPAHALVFPTKSVSCGACRRIPSRSKDPSIASRGEVGQHGTGRLWAKDAGAADATDAWRPSPSGRPGAPKTFSDCAIETALTLRLVFRVPVRQAEGVWRSVLSLMGVDRAAPDPPRSPDEVSLSRLHSAASHREDPSIASSTARDCRLWAKANGLR